MPYKKQTAIYYWFARYTVSFVNDWIFDPNFTTAIEFGRDGLDKCCKYFDQRVNYVTCKNIWIYTPSKKIKKNLKIAVLDWIQINNIYVDKNSIVIK